MSKKRKLTMEENSGSSESLGKNSEEGAKTQSDDQRRCTFANGKASRVLGIAPEQDPLTIIHSEEKNHRGYYRK